MAKVVWGVLGLLAGLCVPRASMAQLVFETPQQLSVSQPGFYAFDSKTNAAFREMLSENRSVGVWISGFTGDRLKIAPAADNHEIGKKKKVRGDTTLALAFKKAAQVYGLSLVPKGTVTLTLMIQPFAGRPCASPVSNCQDDCGGNLGKCCKKDANGNQEKICVAVGTSSCGCGKK